MSPRALLVLCAVAGCGDGKSVLELEVRGSVGALDSLTAVVSNGGQLSDGARFTASSLPATVALVFDRDRAGAAEVTVTALRGADAVASGKVGFTIVPSQVVHASVTLQGSAPAGDLAMAGDLTLMSDLATAPDLGAAPDLASPPDLGPSPDLVVVPSLTGLTPAIGSDAGGTPVTLSGSGFCANATVTFDGRSAAVMFVSGSKLSVVTPANKPRLGDVDVTVTCPGGSSTLPKAFHYFLSAPDFTATPINLGFTSRSAVGTDIDGDGKPEIVVSSWYEKRLVVLGLDNNGQWAIKQTAASFGNNGARAFAGDVNGDKFPDLVVMQYATTSGEVDVFLGNAQGLLTPSQQIAAPKGSYSGRFVDWNGDGWQDFVMASFDAATVSLLLNDKTGKLQAPTTLSTAGNTFDVEVADLDGNGYPDLAIPLQGLKQVGVQRFDANGALALQTYAVGTGPQGIRLADFDGDGKLDVVTADYFASDLSVLLGMGAGQLKTAAMLPTNGGPDDVTVADIDGDGRPDLVSPINSKALAQIYLNAGGGKFQVPIQYPTGMNPDHAFVGDLNRDGKPDILVANNGSTYLTLLLAK